MAGVGTDVIQLLMRPAALLRVRCRFIQEVYIKLVLYRHCPVGIFLKAGMNFTPSFFKCML